MATMEGGHREICYMVSQAGLITALSEETWRAAAGDAAFVPAPEDVVGRPLTDFLWGEEVRASYRAFHDALLQGLVDRVVIMGFCDTPARCRAHRLAICVDRSGGEAALRYTSTLLSEVDREPAEVLNAPADGTPGASGALLRICSYCKRTRLPPGAQEGTWIPSSLYQRHGGSLDVRLSHGICPTCQETYVRPVLQRLKGRRGGAV
jgi:hypothetical protein